MKGEQVRLYRAWWSRVMLSILWMPVLALSAWGQPSIDDKCSVSRPIDFIQTSLEQVTKGAERKSVTETLSCLARSAGRGFAIAESAVRALFTVAEDDSARRRALLNIALDQNVVGEPRILAFELLTYVADDATRAAILAELKRNWPTLSSWADCCNLLRAHGDEEFLKWLEQQIQIPTDPPGLGEFLKQHARQVRVQRNPEDLVTYLEKEATQTHDMVWAARQALRLGVSRERVGYAVMAIIRRDPQNQSRVMEECDELGIFRPEHEAELRPIRERLRHRHLDSLPNLGPPWAKEYIAVRRAEFYRLPAPQPRQEQQRDQQTPPWEEDDGSR